MDNPHSIQIFAQMDNELTQIEQSVYKHIFAELANTNPGRNREACDKIFASHYSRYLNLCIQSELTYRAAIFGHQLINDLLKAENTNGTEYHKGVLFADTALACFLCGNIDQYEYLLAMSDEEDVKTSGGSHQRGTNNLQNNRLTGQTIKRRLQFACDMLNGKIANQTANYTLLTGSPPITPDQLDKWRQNLDALHQFELLRFIHDIYVFSGMQFPQYQPAKNNPFVMLRLAKALAHLAQWVESCLTDWQRPANYKVLSRKYLDDTSFNGLHDGTQANKEQFIRSCPDVDNELRQLLANIVNEPTAATKHRYLLRILLIVRNSTAHTIESSLTMYSDRTFLLELIQAVFVSIFVVSQLKGRPVP